VVRRELEHLGSRYVVLGVGGVMTYPAFRGEGYGHRIVEAATDYIRKSDADVGMLFTGTDLHPFYRQHGWTTLEREGVHYGDPKQPEFSDSHLMILPVSEKGKAHRDDFERGNLYVGAWTW
jgi:predicted acetyltransferase